MIKYCLFNISCHSCCDLTRRPGPLSVADDSGQDPILMVGIILCQWEGGEGTQLGSGHNLFSALTNSLRNVCIS